MLDFLEQVLDARTSAEVWDRLVERMAGFGFDRLLYGLTFETGDSAQIGNLDDTLILSNLTQPYLDRYLGDGLYLHAPMLRWCARNVGSCSWSYVDTVRNDKCPLEKEALSLNHKHGITAGYTISFGAAPPCGRSALSLAARPGLSQADVDTIWDMHGRVIEIMCRTAHMRITTLPRDLRSRHLTPRQREVLQWVGSGKTVQDIAALMEISVGTVEKHLRLAREQLGVETSAQAVLKAAVQSHLFVPLK